MDLTIGEKVKVLMKRRGMTLAELAEATGQTRQNLSNKMSRDQFHQSATQLLWRRHWAAHLRLLFTMEDTGEAL